MKQTAKCETEIFPRQKNYKQALAQAEKLGDKQGCLSGSLADLGHLYIRQGDLRTAETRFKQCLALREKTLGASSQFLDPVLEKLSEIAAKQGNMVEEELFLSRLFAIRQKALLKTDLNYLQTLEKLLTISLKLNHLDGAERYLKLYISLMDKTPGNPAYPQILLDLGALYYNTHRVELAKPLLEKAVALMCQQQTQLTPSFAEATYYLECCLRSMNDYVGAEKYALEALAMRKRLKMYDSGMTNNLETLGDIYLKLNKTAEAVQVWKQAVLQETKTPRSAHCLATDYYYLGLALTAQKQLAEAESAFKQAYAIEEKVAADKPLKIEFRRSLARNALSQGKQLEALGWLKKIQELSPDDLKLAAEIKQLEKQVKEQVKEHAH